MARLTDNLLGKISGKAGSLLFKRTKKGTVITSLPQHTKKPSVPQQIQRNKMKVVMRFLTRLKPLFAENAVGFHSIKSYYLRHAVRWEGETHAIDYSKALVCLGTIRPPEEAYAERITPNKLHITWAPQCEQAMANCKDQLLVVLYHPASHRFFFATCLAKREAGHFTLLLPSMWQPLSFHTWIGFSAKDAQQASLSVHLGEV
jgi:hypothetical protein